MIRRLLVVAVAAMVLAMPVEAKRAIRIYSPAEKLAVADVVVIGKVSAIEKNTVDAAPFPGATEKQSYKVAVIKVETNLVGAANLTHIKVGFQPPPAGQPANPPGRPGRGGFTPVNFTEGMEGLFYLSKHHTGDFYVASPMLAPVENKAEDYKNQIAEAKKGAAVFSDPVKALKADKVDDRIFAASMLLTKYRTYPENAGEMENVKVAAEESKLLLKAIADAEWKQDPNKPEAVNPYQAFSMLGLNDKDGWKFPMVKPGEDFIAKTKEAYVAWLAAAGKDYQVNKLVPKKK